MKKINVGDIFSFKIDENIKIYFQYLGKDRYQLGSDCIAVLNYISRDGENNCTDIINSGLWFITLTWIKYGIKDKYFEQIYRADPILDITSIKFKNYQENFYDTEKGLREVYYLRGFNNDTFVEFDDKEEYIRNTEGAWDDGATLAQGLLEKIKSKLYN